MLIDWPLIAFEIMMMVIGGLFWWLGFRSHQGINEQSVDAVRLPTIICLCFGSVRSDRILSLRGISVQIIAYFVTGASTLGAAKVISPRVVGDLLLVMFIILSLLAILKLLNGRR